VRQNNILNIVRYVRDHPNTTKPLIGEALNLSRPTVNNLIDELIDRGVLQVSGIGISGPSGGKRPQLISLNERYALVVGVALGNEYTSLAVTDLNLQVLHLTNFPTNREELAGAWYHRVYDEYKAAIAQFPDQRVIGMGVAVRGLVDSESGTLTYAAHMPGWTDVPLSEELSSKVMIPVIVEKESNTYAVAEKLFGTAKMNPNFVAIYCGDVIGAGIFIDGRLYHGAHGSAGEIGHMVVTDDGPRCNCGNRGCLETVASAPAILAKVNRKLAQGEKSLLTEMVADANAIGIEHIARAARKGDPMSVDIIREVAVYLGRTVAAVINLYNPEKIILCGPIAKLPLLEHIREETKRYSLPAVADKTDILLSSFGDNMSSVTGASLVINQFFSEQIGLFLQEAGG
jgi:glucokinase-like ROK family protein